MKKILFSLIFILSNFFISMLYSNNGYLADYNFTGFSISKTKVKGNFKFMFINTIKKISGNTFYQEPGNPFPDLVEKVVKVDYKNNKKIITTSDAEEPITFNLKDDYTMLNDKNIKISSSQQGNKKTIMVSLNLPEELGGKQQYIISFIYESSTDDIKNINNITAAGFLSLFIDNEKIINLIGDSLKNDKFKFPSNFSLIWKAGKNEKLNIKGVLESEINMDLSEDDFSY